MSFWSDVKETFNDFVEDVKDTINSIATGLGNVFGGFSDGFRDIVGAFGEVLGGFGSWISNNIIDPIGDTLSGLFLGSSQADPISEAIQARTALLSQAAYAEFKKDMPQEILDRYKVEPVNGIASNDTAWSFTDKITGERYVAVGGTSSVSTGNGLADWISNTFGLGTGIGTLTSRAIAQDVNDHFERTGERTVVVGHSRGGTISEEVARLAPEAVDYVVNVQGPSVIDLLGPIPTLLGIKTVWGMITGVRTVDVYRITSNPDSETSPTTLAQGVLDFLGRTIVPPHDIQIDVGIHSIDQVVEYYTERGYDVFSPVVLDLDGDGVELAGSSQTYFDIDGDGYRESTGWVDADDGLLVVDLMADGTIGNGGDGDVTSGMEFVFSRWAREGESFTDLEALARARHEDGSFVFDSNQDGILDSKTPFGRQ